MNLGTIFSVLTMVYLVRYLFQISKSKPRPLQPTAILVAAYLENEVSVIEKSILSFFKVRGITSIHLAFNGPIPSNVIRLLNRIQSMQGTNGLRVHTHYVPNSRSKAENLNQVIPLLKEDYVIICDADDILYPHALETLFTKMDDHVLCVQSTFRIQETGNLLVWCADVLENTILCLTSILCDFFIFKGHNGLWRKDFLLRGFDPHALTEDFDISLRAQKVGEIRMVGITGESLAPPTFQAYFTQRSRWFHGGLRQWNKMYGLMFSMWFALLSYSIWQVWWSSLVFTFLLTEDIYHTLGSFLGVYVYVTALPVTLFLALKRMILKDTRFNVTPRYYGSLFH